MESRRKKLLALVRAYHAGQERKYTEKPYHTHVEAVAAAAEKDVDDPLAWEIAMLHDTLEDTDVTCEDIWDDLSDLSYSDREISQIVHVVMELTDQYTKEAYPNLNRKERKHLEAERLGRTSGLAQSIKCIDLIDNTKDIVPHDRGFARVYLKEKEAILWMMNDVMGGIKRAAFDTLIDAKKDVGL